MSGIVLENIVKKYGNETIIEGLNLTINEGEFLVIVGPSGCGKSTTLRMIAGLEYVSGGKIHINNIDCTHVEPKSRNIAMVFQNYALYPHMNVADNMSFSLKLSKTSKAEIKKRVDEAAKILDLEEYLDRKPKALSGGQRQRVAMGRAIVRKPYVFLFDEPLSNLDAKLRGQMRTELSLLHKRLNKTTVYVTHDQIEAMTLADRIVIMDKGEIQQIGSPEDVYYNPANHFVAGFIGSPPMNFFESKVESSGNEYYVSWGEFKLPIPEKFNNAVKGHVNTQVTLGIRPEHINYARPGAEYPGFTKCKFKIEVTEFSGTDTYLVANHEGELFKIVCDSTDRLEAGNTYDFAISMNEVRLFDTKTGKALY